MPDPADLSALHRIARRALALGAPHEAVRVGVRFHRICGDWTMEAGTFTRDFPVGPPEPAWSCEWSAYDVGSPDDWDEALALAEAMTPTTCFDAATGETRHPSPERAAARLAGAQ